ncbi:protoporphyrinogen/coproporphyrinogen oxidase [Leptolyngbya sp. 7M]|uniref:protoporphyrinogen/coproporphyrinogen oxidase n=1 Tax=Leptolyngbya sp. 7M TaxID=2812896 RepID=UPI001B8C8C06|nr:NAD(P)-binding protein [Leptolyngbya sp. 7M]QYO63233.1 NAD(P)-binding protein [Leptolyngbya sp. 7M]
MNHHHNHNPRILILGAGPTGLGAAYRLRELGYTNLLMVDRHPYLGGLAHSFTDPQGFTWDIGGHVMFSHYDYYDRVFDRLMGDHFTLNNRESWVRIAGTWVPYPFQNNIRYLPKDLAYECIAGVIKAQTVAGGVKDAIARAANFAEFCRAVFGPGICRHFMDPYNFKVWAHPLESMNKTWIGERVAVIDIDRALRNLVLGLDDYGWGPNNKFKFPLTGGTGEFYNRFGPVLKGSYNLNRNAVAIHISEKKIRFSDGSIEPYDILISTVPVDWLVNSLLVGHVPDLVRHQAARLLHSSGHMVGIGLRRDGGTPSSKCWMYFPESNCPFYRVTYLSNYSPHMTPDRDRYFSLLCETSASAHKPVNPATIVEDTIQGLINAGLLEPADRDAIVSTWHYHADYSYPVPSVERDDILADVIPWLERHSIYSRGRFGMWKYEVSNTDHSLMQGVELVNRLLLGQPEHTIGIVYKVTDDGMQHARGVTTMVTCGVVIILAQI